jgi:hypothetical protein
MYVLSVKTLVLAIPAMSDTRANEVRREGVERSVAQLMSGFEVNAAV